MPRKKRNTFVIILLLLPAFLSGCLPAGGQNKTGAAAKPVITVWHWMTDRVSALEELARQYEHQTGIKVIFELYAPSDAYAQKVRAAAQGVTLPDIFGILAEKRDFASFIKAGHVLDLTGYMEADSGKWKKSLFEKALEVDSFPEGNSFGVESGIYGVPLDMMSIKMLYNKKLFRQLGLDPDSPPQTLDEFLKTGALIKEKKLQGLVSGWAEVWMIECLADNYAFNIMGKDKFLATLKGEVPYTDPDWVRVFAVFKQLQESGILANGVVTMINKTAEQLFANEKAVFAFNGSWGVNVYRGMNPGLEYCVMLPPKASDANPMSFWGAAGSSFMVNARSKNREEAVKFLQWLTARNQQLYLAVATVSLPANRDSLAEVPDALAPFAQRLELSTHPNTWEVSEFPEVTEALGKGIQSIIIGEKTPEQVASEVQKVKERETLRVR